MKNSLAYVRSLHYDRATRAEAEEGFNRVFDTKYFPVWHQRPIVTSKAFRDYMFHFILDIANRRQLVLQIHTGIQEGNGNYLSDKTTTPSV